jgi:iron complex outermembrane receptor protein
MHRSLYSQEQFLDLWKRIHRRRGTQELLGSFDAYQQCASCNDGSKHFAANVHQSHPGQPLPILVKTPFEKGRRRASPPAIMWCKPIVVALLNAVLVCSSLAADDEPAESKRKLSEMSIDELMKVSVSPFYVSTREDKGYLASNSVSGSRIDTPIRDLPFAIQAFTEAFIEDQHPVNIYDIAKYSPGVTYRSNDFNEGNANLSIRGFAVSSTAGNTQILRDGFPGPSIFDFTNISRVEVVKGPASFLYGQLAPGGIVNIITKSPQPVFAATARATYGSYDSYRFDADVTGPIVKGLDYRLAYSYDQDIRYWDPYDAHSMDIAPSLLWKPNDRLSISVKYENFSKREDPQVMQKPGYPAPNLSGVDVPGLASNWNSMAYTDYRHSNTNSVETSIDFKADDHWNVRAGYGWEKYTVDMLETGNFGMANDATFLQGRRVKRTIYTNDDNTFEGEAVGKYNFHGVSLRLLLGAQLIDRDFKDVEGQAPNNPTLGSNPTASPLPLWDLTNPATWNHFLSIPIGALTADPVNNITNYQDKAIYAGTTFGFFDDRLLLLAGWRETRSESQLTNNLTNTSNPKFEASKVTPQYGILYKLRPDFSLFASYAESFVPGSQILLVKNVPTTPATPTVGEGYDIGFKADLFDGRVSGTVTVFDDREKNIVNDIAELDPATGQQIFTNVQSGEQRSRGVELDTTISLTKNWQAYLSYSYMDAKIVEFSGNDTAILAQNPATLDAARLALYQNVARFHNAPLQMSAPQLANIWSRYNFTQDFLKGVYVAGGANFVFHQALLSDTPQDYYQTYALLNALAGYSWNYKGTLMSLELIGKNLTDVYYRPSQSTRPRPREINVSYSIKF